jgi:hypothetical protein
MLSKGVGVYHMPYQNTRRTVTIRKMALKDYGIVRSGVNYVSTYRSVYLKVWNGTKKRNTDTTTA